MKFNDYPVAARVTARADMPSLSTPQARMLNWALGLSGETGELNDHIKKHIFHGHDLDIDYVVKELGDIMWYVANMAHEVDRSLESVADTNIDKLKNRYGGEFSIEASINREQ